MASVSEHLLLLQKLTQTNLEILQSLNDSFYTKQDHLYADINDTTVNNYCIGIRSINNEYKQKYITYKKKYKKNKYILIDIILNILTIINGNIYTNLNINDKLNIINNNNILKKVTTKLYNVSKNDKEVTKELSNEIIDMYFNRNLGSVEIGKTLDISKTTVMNVINSYKYQSTASTEVSA